ncbi:Hydrolase-4 domain-containing protein [Mycena sanguinolenta]|uniref:Hydrolase-4 domain-containing protein n=1 Tax=Mycena sanguinolenta TaxID=230812 RepID=A0A8H7D335_9AGAR|nr:Hydrolase-4 domain-containing protein [Mycena sanguinolenta]
MQQRSNFIRTYGPVVTTMICSVTILNLWVIIMASKNRDLAPSKAKEFTWVMADFPEFWQVEADDIAMVVEETARYSITGIDAKEDWASNSPAGFGYLRVGPEKRDFALDLAHQLHCLRNLRGGLAGDHSPKMLWHVQHCLNFLRMMMLCFPNLTLEPADVLERDFEVHRTGATHVCRDWRQYFEKMEENWYDFIGNRSSIFEA